MVIALLRNGDELLEIIPGDVPPVPAPPDAPITFTQVFVKYQGRYLLLYNPERQQWEVPGGALNEGETLDACARREVEEESTQVIETPVYKGLFKLRLQPDGRLEYGALYCAQLREVRPFIPNEEAAGIVFWNRAEALDAGISILTRNLFDFC